MTSVALKASLEKLETQWLNAQNAINDWAQLWHLALRGRSVAMTELARRLGSGGMLADPFSPRGLARRAYRRGDPTAAYNLAMDCFNNRDLQGYRRWLRRAALQDFPDAKEQLAHFETRLPHIAAYSVRRGRPRRPYD